MRCPNPKHKKPFNLKTERTMANGREVTRVRICPKCKQRVETVELFSVDWKATLAGHERTIREAFDERDNASRELRRVRALVGALVDFAASGGG